MNILSEYIKYLAKAKGRHGTHSPFVYDFVDKCLRKKVNPTYLQQLKSISSFVIKNDYYFEVQDFGAGSKKLPIKRNFKSIYRQNTTKGKYGKLLHKITNHYQPNRILELGTSIGIGTISLTRGDQDIIIETIEGDKNIHSFVDKLFHFLDIKNTHTIHSDFKSYISKYTGESFDLVFIDGHHDGNALLNYLNELKQITHNDTIFILDDIRWSDSMLDAWKKIVKDEYFHLTMDLFRMGIVIPRKQQVKEHFIIKI